MDMVGSPSNAAGSVALKPLKPLPHLEGSSSSYLVISLDETNQNQLAMEPQEGSFQAPSARSAKKSTDQCGVECQLTISGTHFWISSTIFYGLRFPLFFVVV